MDSLASENFLSIWKSTTKECNTKISKSWIIKPTHKYEIFKELEKLRKYKSFVWDDHHYLIGNEVGFTITTQNSNPFMELIATFYGVKHTINKAINDIEKLLTPCLADIQNLVMMEVGWYYSGGMGMDYTHVKELVHEELHGEAYPSINNLEDFINEYLDSDSSVLLLLGKQGMGKSRLIRYILMKYALRFKTTPSVTYSTDMNLLKDNDAFFLNFKAGEDEFMVLEDIDKYLISRQEDNEIMHKFLAISDGFLSNINKKIINVLPLSVKPNIP